MHERTPSTPYRCLLALALVAPVATADTLQTFLNGSFVEAVRVGDYVVPAAKLGAGRSEGQVSFEDQGGLAIQAADNRNLNLYFARAGTDPNWQISFDAWVDTNGPKADFFLFEVGGNDAVQIAPRFANGSYGMDTAIGGWTATGYAVSVGANSGQQVYGLSFPHSALRDAGGNALSGSVVLTGLRIRSAGVDGCALLYVDPRDIDQGDGDGSVRVLGARRVHQPLTVEYDGPWASSTDDSPDNPFLDRRLDVRFTGPEGQVYLVPGFFDGDGEGKGFGVKWRARFTPDSAGTWQARASFRVGPAVAVASDASAGSPGMLDGVQLSFVVQPPQANAPGFLKHGPLTWKDGHYRVSASGEHFVKCGVNSPENFLAYRGFDNVADGGGAQFLHSYAPHVADWRAGDPFFQSNVHDADSKGIIGALNYLSGQGVNSLFMLVLNLGGDGWDVHPFAGPDDTSFDKTHYDVGRLRQWEMVFEHAMEKGIALHLGLAETEPLNELWLDQGTLGPERKLFFRELVARFAHHPAIKWNLCEENDYSIARLREFSDWLRALDPYDHPIAVHNHPDDMSDYMALLGDDQLDATSLQFDPDQVGAQVESLRALSAAAGKPWIVEADENNPWNTGLTNANASDLRKRVLYDVLFSGGGVEWYMGYHSLPLGGDLNVEDFRTRESMWRYMRYARELLEQNLRYWEMQPADALLSGESAAYGGGEVFAHEGKVYAIYLPDASPSGSLDLSATSGSFHMRWYDPRNGAFVGSPTTLHGGGHVSLGSAPNSQNEDWVVLIERQDGPTVDLVADVEEISVLHGGTQTLQLDAGPTQAGRIYHVLGSTSGMFPGTSIGGQFLALNPDRYMRTTWARPNQGMLQGTRGPLDSQGRGQARVHIAPLTFSGWMGVTFYHAYLLVDGGIDYASVAVPLRLVP